MSLNITVTITQDISHLQIITFHAVAKVTTLLANMDKKPYKLKLLSANCQDLRSEQKRVNVLSYLRETYA